MLERLFHIRQAGSTPGREVLGGLTTFLTMAYIIFVNPAILSKAGVPMEGAIIATCVAAAFATLLMAFLANYPIALAPGMGLNAFFAYTICGVYNVPWETALGLVFWSGLLFLILTFTGLRQMIVRAVPRTLKLSAAVGIGLFISFIGLQHGGIVTADSVTLVKMGDLTTKPAVLTLIGLAVTLLLVAAKVRTAIFWGMSVAITLAIFSDTVAVPEEIVKVPALDFPGFRMDLNIFKFEYLPLLLVLLFFDIFDTMGTLMGVAHEGGFLINGQLPRVERAMTADAAGSLD